MCGYQCSHMVHVSFLHCYSKLSCSVLELHHHEILQLPAQFDLRQSFLVAILWLSLNLFAIVHHSAVFSSLQIPHLLLYSSSCALSNSDLGPHLFLPHPSLYGTSPWKCHQWQDFIEHSERNFIGGKVPCNDKLISIVYPLFGKSHPLLVQI